MFPNPLKRILVALLALSLAALACGKKTAVQIYPGFGSTQQCQNIDLGIPFQADSSSASTNTYTTNLLTSSGQSAQEVVISGRLTCVWQEAYQSAEKVGTIRANLEILTIQDPGQAQAMFSSLSQEVSLKPDYCREDHDCTVAVESFGADRTYYIEKNVYGLRTGNPLPSYHSARLVRLISASGENYVLDLTVDHPELSPASDFVADVVAEIEISLVPQTAGGPEPSQPKPSATPDMQ